MSPSRLPVLNLCPNSTEQQQSISSSGCHSPRPVPLGPDPIKAGTSPVSRVSDSTTDHSGHHRDFFHKWAIVTTSTSPSSSHPHLTTASQSLRFPFTIFEAFSI
ncbi:hypothetical protein EPR50_G00072920 [Perca flavescens]|uniref:Uncharacterized protein n=1 Tax=Perca flavescens TaxID=8167 RepID=A0A484D4D0_PERFV|nr:hypothetical protein EPR50_G00072920 [Perca flavescens]